MAKDYNILQEEKRKLQRKVFAKQKEYEEIVKMACPSIDNRSGVYFYTRTDLITGERFMYIGLAKHLLQRCCQHMLGYQHIDISIRKRGLYSKDNEGGWKLTCMSFPEHLIEEKERYYIEKYKNENVTLLNIESGGREGKEIIGERKPAKTYMDGLKQGDKRTKRKVKQYFDNYLCFGIKEPTNAIKSKKYNEFKEWLESDE